MSKVLVIGDLHEPAAHPAYLQFCKDIKKKYRCNEVIFIGDVVDNQAISFHANNPNCPGVMDELLLAKEKIAKWQKAFPRAKVCIGNHDERITRLAESVNIPAAYLKNYSEIFNTPKWEWGFDFIIDDVYYFHGTGQGGVHPAWTVLSKQLMSVVMGHCHSRAGVKWKVNPQRRVFGMDVGCGIDVKAYQFAYGKHCKEKPILGCGVVIDGVPYHEIMPCDDNEKYSKQKFI